MPKLGASDSRTPRDPTVPNTLPAKNFVTSYTTAWVRLSLPSYIVSSTPSSSIAPL